MDLKYPWVNPSTLPIVGGGAAVNIPEYACAVEVENYADSGGDMTITFHNGNTYLVKPGITKSFGVSNRMCEMAITCAAGTNGQCMWM